jgi:hypothetical protein
MGAVINVIIAFATMVVAWFGMDEESRKSKLVWLAAALAFVGLIANGVQTDRLGRQLSAAREDARSARKATRDTRAKVDRILKGQEFQKGQLSMLGKTAASRSSKRRHAEEGEGFEDPNEPPCTTFLEMTPDQIWNAGDTCTAYERDNHVCWKKYEGACVKWTLPLKAIETEEGKGTAIVYLAAGRIGLLTVMMRVQEADYPRLRQLPQKASVEVVGRITWVVVANLALHNVQLTFPSSSPLTPTDE